jgi:hypothetical protein
MGSKSLRRKLPGRSENYLANTMSVSELMDLLIEDVHCEESWGRLIVEITIS